MDYINRYYRDKMKSPRFSSFEVSYLETDLWIGVDPESFSTSIKDFCHTKIVEYREQLNNYIKLNTAFKTSLSPILFDPYSPAIAQHMMQQTQIAGVGPMASVAGVFAHFLGNDIIKKFKANELIIENGGDIFLLASSDLSISVFAGKSPLSGKIGVKIPANLTPLGICTSSGTVGPSFSMGKADAAMIICHDAALADAYASTFGNLIQTTDDIQPTINKIQNTPEILSAIIVKDDKFGICGKFKLEIFKQ
jgi:ApbE superfamily uncharacterized protein (UPF0280 family)